MSILLSLSRFLGLSSHDWDFGLGSDLPATPAAEPGPLALREAAAHEAASPEAGSHETGSHEARGRELYGMAAAIHSLYQDGVGFDANDRH